MIGEEGAAAVGGSFFEAGRFEKDQLAEKIEHLGKAWFEEGEKVFGERVGRHFGRGMVATERGASNGDGLIGHSFSGECGALALLLFRAS